MKHVGRGNRKARDARAGLPGLHPRTSMSSPMSVDLESDLSWRNVAGALGLMPAAMMARRVWRQRPQSAPAPHAAATCLDAKAPLATTSPTISLVAPVHRHTHIPLPPLVTPSCR